MNHCRRVHTRGAFTIPELLIVFSILVILSTSAVYVFQNARKKGRDARRVADVTALMSAMHQAEQEGASLAGPCAGTGGPYALNRCSFSPALGTAAFDFTRLEDPSKITTLCTSASTAACAYSIQGASAGVAATPGAYRVYFFIESSGGSLSPGLRTATADGVN